MVVDVVMPIDVVVRSGGQVSKQVSMHMNETDGLRWPQSEAQRQRGASETIGSVFVAHYQFIVLFTS